MSPYQNGFNNTIPFSDTSPTIALAANTALPYTVPGTSAQRYKIYFSWPYNANVWVCNNGTATVPTPGTINSSSACMYRPGANDQAYYVRGGDVLSFISDGVIYGGFSLYALPA
jgi:hypothetical protein